MPTVIERPFTLLVADRPILSFMASTFNEANELTREEWLRADLLKYRSNDESLWDGAAKLTVRASDAEEKAALEQERDLGRRWNCADLPCRVGQRLIERPCCTASTDWSKIHATF